MIQYVRRAIIRLKKALKTVNNAPEKARDFIEEAINILKGK